MLAAQISMSREFKNIGISTLSIGTSRDPYCSLKSQHRYQNSRSGVTVLLSLVYPYFEIDIKQDEIHKALFMLTKQETERIE